MQILIWTWNCYFFCLRDLVNFLKHCSELMNSYLTGGREVLWKIFANLKSADREFQKNCKFEKTLRIWKILAVVIDLLWTPWKSNLIWKIIVPKSIAWLMKKHYLLLEKIENKLQTWKRTECDRRNDFQETKLTRKK